MDEQKQVGPAKLEIVVKEGAVALKASMEQGLGGGEAAGILAFKATVEIDVSAIQAVELARAMLKAHFPAIGGIIDSGISAIEAEIKKI